MSLQKLVFFLHGRLGRGKEKRFPFSKKMSLLWDEERRARAYSDPLSINLGTVDLFSLCFWCFLGLPSLS